MRRTGSRAAHRFGWRLCGRGWLRDPGRLALHHPLALGGVSSPVSHAFSRSSGQSVVLGSPVVGVEELLEPLQKLEVVLEPALDQLVDRHYLEWG